MSSIAVTPLLAVTITYLYLLKTLCEASKDQFHHQPKEWLSFHLNSYLHRELQRLKLQLFFE